MRSHKQRAEWDDPRSVSFRAAVKSWSFMDHSKLNALADRAQPHAWLPDHFKLLETIRGYAEGAPP